MFAIPEQFSSATRSTVEAQVALFASLSNKMFESVEKVIDLNLNTAKASLEDTNAAARQLLSAKDLQEFLSVSATQTQPNTEKALAYSRNLAGIASAAQAEFTKTAEEQFAEANRKVVALIDEVSKNAPAGSDAFVSLFKTAVGNANAGYEQFSKGAKQATALFETNVNSAVNQFAQAATKAGAAKTAKK